METIRQLFTEANLYLPVDVCSRIREYRENETYPIAAYMLDAIIENFEIASEKAMPVCQDTGMACVFLDIGQDVHIEGDVNTAVNEGVRRACREGYLRASIVTDPLERHNSGDNTPALVYIDFVSGDRVTVTVAPKGFGSENMSRIAMLSPSDGKDRVIAFVIETVKKAGANPCPPIVAGVGIGGNFDKAALLAKKAVLRPLGIHNPHPMYADMEKELLEKVNALGIGPAGFGGKTTALFVAVETMPTHIAGLPVAVNITCHVSRHASAIL
jgi:fumarate hydratase subunit alpha